jgi:hypothetical protein
MSSNYSGARGRLHETVFVWGYCMCDFLSFYIGWKGEIYAGDLMSHESAEEQHDLSAAL